MQLDQFRSTYLSECDELLILMEEKLLSLNETTDIEELHAIFRCAHSIKGGAGAFGLKEIESFTHILENLLDQLRERKLTASKALADVLLKATDIVKAMVEDAKKGKNPSPDFGKEVLAELERYAGVKREAASTAVTQKTSDRRSGMQMFRIIFIPSEDLFSDGSEPLFLLRELSRLGKAEVNVNTNGLLTSENFNPEKCYLSWVIDLETTHQQAAVEEVFEFVAFGSKIEIKDVAGIIEEEEKAAAEIKPENNTKKTEAVTESAQVVSSIRVDISKVDALVNMVGEMVITQAMIAAQTATLPPEKFPKLLLGVDELSMLARELQEAVMALRMQPVKSIFSRMPRIVRDLSQQLNKDIRLEMHGEATEIDKTVIEQLSDPLTHLIRNAVDHGVETPEDREKNGKPTQGLITLSADHRGGRIIIEIRDDGAGLPKQKILKKAIEKGLVQEGADLSDSEIEQLIFMPGFSTAAAVTNVSGRGVGMDVVKRNIASLGGSIEVESVQGKGTTFAISLPLTLAILDGMIVRVGQEKYIIPINNIIESLKPKRGDISPVADGSSVINVRGEFIPVLSLARVFNVATTEATIAEPLIVLVESGRHKVGLQVEELIGQQQVVIKSIEENTEPVEGVSGATILGDGNVSLILDVGRLQKMTIKHNSQKLAA